MYGYDGLNRLTSYSLGGSSSNYEYDARGNRIKENGVQRWAYDAANVLISIDGNAVTTDASGNMTAKPVASGMLNMSYDKQNQMRHAVQVGSAALVNTYDATGKRIRKIEGGYETIYVYMGNYVAYERNIEVSTQDNVVETDYISVGNRRVMKIINYDETSPNGEVQFMITDHLGSTRVILAADGSVVQRFDYKPFGEDVTSTQEFGEKYTGKLRTPLGCIIMAHASMIRSWGGLLRLIQPGMG